MGKRMRGEKANLPARPGPVRKHHCPEHGVVMAPVKVWGSGMIFKCPEGCRLGRNQTDLR